jgi:hypothetical protein
MASARPGRISRQADGRLVTGRRRASRLAGPPSSALEVEAVAEPLNMQSAGAEQPQVDRRREISVVGIQ